MWTAKIQRATFSERSPYVQLWDFSACLGLGGVCRLRCVAVRWCWGHLISILVWMVTETFGNLHTRNWESLIVSVILAAELQPFLII